jgi:bifunctional non-homologous end joining protein LigD
MEHITLYFKQGSSDKVYQASIESKDDGYVVNFAFGRRGTTLATGTKTPAAVNLDAARAIYDKLVKEKQAKGYTPGEDGTPYQHTDKANQTTGIHCQLLNPIERDQVDKLIADPGWWMQEKFDGRRLLIRKQADSITGINRLGLSVALPDPMVATVKSCRVDVIIDGEAIGDMLCAFDVLRIGDEEIGGLRYGERYLRLLNLFTSCPHPAIHVVETAFLPGQKLEMFHRLKDEGREGVVFKQIDAPYIAGRPASGGPQLKYKFCETASFIVGKVNGKRSVGLLLFNGERITSAGNVTIPLNHEIPVSGQVIECRYLYAFRESGSIYQPVYLGSRDDITSEECITDQLKYKVETKEES